MHFELFPGARQLELEVGHMTMNLFNPEKECCSIITTGGTESNLLAVRTYKEWAYATKGITKPEIVMALSGHPSFNKACEYFGVKLVTVPIDPVTL
jgi:sphinganine-1-phosphate aldolase